MSMGKISEYPPPLFGGSHHCGNMNPNESTRSFEEDYHFGALCQMHRAFLVISTRIKQPMRRTSKRKLLLILGNPRA